MGSELYGEKAYQRGIRRIYGIGYQHLLDFIHNGHCEMHDTYIVSNQGRYHSLRIERRLISVLIKVGNSFAERRYSLIVLITMVGGIFRRCYKGIYRIL